MKAGIYRFLIMLGTISVFAYTILIFSKEIDAQRDNSKIKGDELWVKHQLAL